jgi:exonuclease III
MKIEIMGICEMRWPGSGNIEKEEYKIFYSGSTEGRFERGVGVITSKNVGRSVTNFIPITDGVLLLQVQLNPINMNIIQIYDPTANKSEEEVEFIKNIKEVFCRCWEQIGLQK